MGLLSITPHGHKINRRKLLIGGAAGAAIPVVHGLVPHSGVHQALEGASAAEQHGGAAIHGGASAVHGGGNGGPTFKQGEVVDHASNGFNPTEMLRDFDYGKTTRLASGRVLREWTLVAGDKEIEVAPGVKYPAWTYNGRVPGPTLRANEGELLRIRFVNGSEHPHTIHFHGLHPSEMDGVPGLGAGLIDTGGETTYEFNAEPFGLHLYHCHAGPLAEHIARGLYGAFIIDPEGGASRGRRDDDDDERLQHELRRRGQPDLRGQHGRLPLRQRADRGRARQAGPDLPREHPRVRPDQLVPRPRELLQPLPDRARR